MKEIYFLRCRECGKKYPNQPQSYCEECFAPLEVSYDYEALRQTASREALSRRAFNMWRYAEFLPLPQGFTPSQPIGGTPLVKSRKLGLQLGIKNLYFKNDAVCFPTLSFKDRVVATALAAARRFGFETIGCSSTGNLANAVAAQGAQQGFDTCVFIPADLEPAKVLNTAVYGARILRINGNYDHVNRLCAQIADRFKWGLVNVNLRPYYSEGSKTHGFETAQKMGWRLTDRQNCQGLPRIGDPRLGRTQAGQVLRCASDRLFAHLHRGQAGPQPLRATETQHHRSLAGHRQPRRRQLRRETDPLKWRLGRRRFRPRNRRRHQTP